MLEFKKLLPGHGGVLRRSLHMQHVTQSFSKNLNLARNPELRLFFRLLKSPGHMLFLATNVAVLVHLKLLSTMKKNRQMDHLALQAAELENYESVITDLDQKNEEIQREIAHLKSQRTKEREPTSARLSHEASRDQAKRAEIDRLAFQNQHSLAERFVQSRANFVSAFSNPDNIAALFASHKPTSHTETDLPTRTYSSPIQNSMMLLSNLLITSCAVELNVRFALRDKDLDRLGYFRPDLFMCMKDDDDKRELLQNLGNLRKDKARNFKPFKKQLSPTKVLSFLSEAPRSDYFASRELRRQDMYLHKSGRWRNHEDSDTRTEILAQRGPVFYSNRVNNEEYLTKFRDLFSAFKQDAHPHKHLILALEIAKVLASGGTFIPSYAIFRDLLDKFGKLGLNNYQSLVYDGFPDFEHRGSAWADGAAPHALAEKGIVHFERHLKDDPKLLGTLIAYHRKRGNIEPINELLQFLQPAGNIQMEQDVLPRFMIKPVKADKQKVCGGFEDGVLFDRGAVEQAVKASFESGDVRRTDSLLSKLVFNLIETPEGLRVFHGGKFSPEELVINKYPADEAIGKIFSASMMKTLKEAYTLRNDKDRRDWVISLENSCSRQRSRGLSLFLQDAVKAADADPTSAQSTGLRSKTGQLHFESSRSFSECPPSREMASA